MSEQIWTCKIGGASPGLPLGADLPMREAIREAFRIVAGAEPQFCFSGWGGKLTEIQRSIVENRPHDPSKCDDVESLKEQLAAAVKRAEAAEAALRVQTKQIGVACDKHDLIHALACGYCLRDAETDAKRWQMFKRIVNVWRGRLSPKIRVTEICPEFGDEKEIGSLDLEKRIDEAMRNG